mmetsp:Transcript_18862/g.40525  ORF Transcript_18862/g.40525 Transcript_18862/m.40525 type:complete len:445 (+) Transcript_18862:237-1571(+)|eukprot:CAMPEP_0206495160 /NCGR_PEP_ID=MMETSP0324_2-20121206/48275_1 /ASSEMBLY_ACC=CAM_ASM_000836 /TAXON_ID=2866 /ORGANISM="Crypthecodinium cohnii, Strain Seligo" /LENGTH=444 /DNA_ID=CAMNT_0053979187 /DNA_START=160 /DNA_END=1494 /DNA_ORIENTATION=+
MRPSPAIGLWHFACCHKYKFLSSFLVGLVAYSSVLDCLSAEVLRNAEHHGVGDRLKSTFLLRREALDFSGSNRLTESAERVIRVRGNLSFSKAALTEGPARFMRNPVHFDSVEAYFLLPETLPQETYILGWKPVVQKQRCADGTEVELVHHMNVHAKTNAEAKELFKNKSTVLGQISDDNRYTFVATYDRGALEYRLPANFGIALGPGATRLMLEWHLLKPKCWDFHKQQAVLDYSGFDLFVTSERPRHLAAIMGYTDESMQLAPGQGLVEQISRASPSDVERLSPSRTEGQATVFHKVGKPSVTSSLTEILAIHLHTHDLPYEKYFTILKEDGNARFQSKPEAAGYGDSQSMKSLAAKGWPRLFIHPGDSLQTHCRFDTDKLDHVVNDGTSWGEEMCSALMVVTNADIDSSQYRGWTALSSSGGTISRLSRALVSLFPSLGED